MGHSSATGVALAWPLGVSITRRNGKSWKQEKEKMRQHLDIMENTEELEHIYIRLQVSPFLVTLRKTLEILLLFLLYGLISSKYMKY